VLPHQQPADHHKWRDRESKHAADVALTQWRERQHEEANAHHEVKTALCVAKLFPGDVKHSDKPFR
jgi:hypothetical protein